MCLLEITERVSVHIFEQTKPGIVIVLASELLYLVSSMILEQTPFSTQQIDFGKTVNLCIYSRALF